MQIEPVDTQRCRVGESALWDPVENALYFVDIFAQKLFRHDPAGAPTRSWALPGQPGALGLCDEGGAVFAVGNSLYTLEFDSGSCTAIAGPVSQDPRARINDGTVDRHGRFLFGLSNSDFGDPEPMGGLYRLDADRELRQLGGDIHTSNGHCLSPDGKTLYCSDSLARLTYAYDYDQGSGEAVNRRVFANAEDLGGLPDGATVDADGLVWMAIFSAARIVAYRPDGRRERVIEMPVNNVTDVAFGGANLDILYVTTIDPVELGGEPQDGAGHVFAIEGLGAKGLPEARFGC